MKTTRPLRSFLLRAWLALFGSAALSLHAANYTTTTTTADSTADSGAGSLRQAITDANANPGADTIDFSALFNTPQTITLGGTQLPAITDHLTVTGPAVGVTISGNNLSRVLDIGDAPGNLHPTVVLDRRERRPRRACSGQ